MHAPLLAFVLFGVDIVLMLYAIVAFIIVGVGLTVMILFTKAKLVSNEECHIQINDDPSLSKTAAALTLSSTRWTMGFPQISARTFPGSLVEPILACTMAAFILDVSIAGLSFVPAVLTPLPPKPVQEFALRPLHPTRGFADPPSMPGNAPSLAHTSRSYHMAPTT